MVPGILKRCPTGLQILKVCHWAPTLQRGTLLDASGCHWTTWRERGTLLLLWICCTQARDCAHWHGAMLEGVTLSPGIPSAGIMVQLIPISDGDAAMSVSYHCVVAGAVTAVLVGRIRLCAAVTQSRW